MRVMVIELPAAWGEPGRMLDEVERRLAQVATDLVLLPEASLTGYVSPAGDFDVAQFAEPLDGPTATRCAAIARAKGVHLVAPSIVREGRAVYNAMIGFDPSGAQTFVYRKRHPWLPETWATPGPHPPPVVEICGLAVTIAVCYDVHFLSGDAASELTRADLLLFPSAWVERPDNRARHLAELARRFDLHVANANWAPGVVRVPGQGGSCVIAPSGAIIATASLAGDLSVDVDRHLG